MKKKIVPAVRLHPSICPQSWALVHGTMKQWYFCYFDIKNEFHDTKNPYVAIFGHQIASEMELQQNLPQVAKKSNCFKLKNHLRYWKIFYFIFFSV